MKSAAVSLSNWLFLILFEWSGVNIACIQVLLGIEFQVNVLYFQVFQGNIANFTFPFILQIAYNFKYNC